jgi:hypothetical protein
VKRWKEAENLEDKSSRPHRFRTDLTQLDIERILCERKQFKKRIEDIFFVLEDEILKSLPDEDLPRAEEI